jgi:hypothetical protein
MLKKGISTIRGYPSPRVRYNMGPKHLEKMTVEHATGSRRFPEELPELGTCGNCTGCDFHEDEMAGNVGNI